MANNNKFAFSQPYNEIILNENLSLAAKVIYCVLKIHENKETHDCYPSIKTLAKEAGISENTARKAIIDLEKSRIIKIKRRKINNKEWESNLYLMQDLDFIKEKEPDTLQADQSNNESSTKLNQDIDNTIINSNKSQELRYTMHEIKEHFNYSVMIHDNPDQKDSIDAVMNILYDTLNTSKKLIRVDGEDKPAMSVQSKLMKLNMQCIMYAIDKYSENTVRVKNPVAYMLTILYTSQERMHFDISNQVSHDMYNL